MLTRITRIAATIAILALALALVACSSATKTPSAEEPPAGESGDGAASGTRLAPGLHELEDGTAQALGTLEYRDLEGGVWLIVDTAGVAGEAGATLAVVANAVEFQSELEALQGSQVLASGTLFEGASIRMAGPELEIVSIEAVDDTGGPAE